jgi:hypothetical protein
LAATTVEDLTAGVAADAPPQAMAMGVTWMTSVIEMRAAPNRGLGSGPDRSLDVETRSGRSGESGGGRER